MFIPNASKVWKRLWSIRMAMLAALVQGAALFWFALEGLVPPIPFFAAGILLTIAVVPARLLSQTDIDK